MKLIFAIVQDDDASRVITQLMSENFGVTKMATTGGFLRSGNTTLLVGVEDDRFSQAMAIIEKVCKSRKQVTTTSSPMSSVGNSFGSFPLEVTVGGATVFVLSVEQFVKM